MYAGEEGSPARGMMPEIPPNADISFDLELMSIGADESKTKAAKERLEIARAERDAAAAERLKAQQEKVGRPRTYTRICMYMRSWVCFRGTRPKSHLDGLLIAIVGWLVPQAVHW